MMMTEAKHSATGCCSCTLKTSSELLTQQRIITGSTDCSAVFTACLRCALPLLQCPCACRLHQGMGCNCPRGEGHTGESMALEVSVPGATVIRQLALLRAMEERHPIHYSKYGGRMPLQQMPDIKEAVRLSLSIQLQRVSSRTVCQVGHSTGSVA